MFVILHGLKPDLENNVEGKQTQQKMYYDSIGDPVYVRNFGRGPLWLSGHTVHSTNYVSFLDRSTCRHHIRCGTEENTT